MDLKIDITVSLSKETMAFLSGIINNGCNCTCNNGCQCLSASDTASATDVAPVPATPEEPAKPTRAKRKPADKPAPVEAPKPAEEPAPTEVSEVADTPEEAKPEYKVEDVRKAMAAKVNDHRDELVSKLRELGAKNVSSLDPAKYGEFIDYINSL